MCSCNYFVNACKSMLVLMPCSFASSKLNDYLLVSLFSCLILVINAYASVNDMLIRIVMVRYENTCEIHDHLYAMLFCIQ